MRPFSGPRASGTRQIGLFSCAKLSRRRVAQSLSRPEGDVAEPVSVHALRALLSPQAGLPASTAMLHHCHVSELCLHRLRSAGASNAARHGRPSARKRARHRLGTPRAVGSEDPSDFNMDDLAQQLSSEASKLRSTYSESQDPLDEADAPEASQLRRQAERERERERERESRRCWEGSARCETWTAVMPQQVQVPPMLQSSAQLELSGDDSVLEQLGDGGFDAEDFQLQQLLGQLNFVRWPWHAQRTLTSATVHAVLAASWRSSGPLPAVPLCLQHTSAQTAAPAEHLTSCTSCSCCILCRSRSRRWPTPCRWRAAALRRQLCWPT